MDRADFLRKLAAIKERVTVANGEIFTFEIGEPTSPRLIDEIEHRYGVSFPADFARFLTTVAGKVDISWGIFTDRWAELDRQFAFNIPYSGRLFWSAD